MYFQNVENLLTDLGECITSQFLSAERLLLISSISMVTVKANLTCVYYINTNNNGHGLNKSGRGTEAGDFGARVSEENDSPNQKLCNLRLS